MHIAEDYQGFRIEAEAQPIGTSVTVKIFALGEDGRSEPGAEPMNVQSFEAVETGLGAAELMQSAIAHARTGIDNLLGGSAQASDERPRHEIVDEAQAGKPGRLAVPFVAMDREERLQEMVRVLDSYPLEGLRAKIIMNAVDFQDQPTPAERPDLIGVEASDEVPAGEFHLLLKSNLGAGSMIQR